mmetsp:Transcript_124561/g.360203  ORF Transcript_124561/g.360203 Transcript_124561/m.360203 type:complete len:327 (+) Transcript_124561:1057-2037(+)
MSTGLSGKVRMDWIVAWMKPRLTMSSWYSLLRDKLRTMPNAASMRPAWSGDASSTAAKEDNQPEDNNVFCTSLQSVAQVQIAAATAARVSMAAAAAETAQPSRRCNCMELLKAAINASTPPCCKTVKQQSSFTAKLLRNRHTETTNEGRPAPLLSTSTSTVMLPSFDKVLLCRVRFAMMAKVVTASSKIAVSFWCFLRRSMMMGTVPKRVRMLSAWSTTLSDAKTSRQTRAITASAAWRSRRTVPVESNPFCTAMPSLIVSFPKSLANKVSTRRRTSSLQSSWARSQEQSAGTRRCNEGVSMSGLCASSSHKGLSRVRKASGSNSF